jgi:hypothetical protein
MRVCTTAIAATISDSGLSAPPKVAPSRFEELSWRTAKAGVKLYDGSHRHEATMVAVDRGAGLIHVRFVRTGTVEPKRLEAVAKWWYVAK